MTKVECPYCYQRSEKEIPPEYEITNTGPTLASISKVSDDAMQHQCDNPFCEREFWIGYKQEK